MIIDDLKELDLLRESYDLSNKLLAQLEKDIERLELLLTMEKKKSSLYKEQIDLMEGKDLNGFQRFLADAWKFLAGAAAGLVAGLILR